MNDHNDLVQVDELKTSCDDSDSTRKYKFKRFCSSVNCVRDRSKKLHKFPALFFRGCYRQDNLIRCKEWIKFSGNRKLLEEHPRELSNKYFLCSDHFAVDQYYNNNRERLLYSAKPTEQRTCDPLTDDDFLEQHAFLKDLEIVSATENTDNGNDYMNVTESAPPDNNGTIGEEPGPSTSNENILDINQIMFEKVMNSYVWRICETCRERFLTLKDNKKKCSHTKPICESLSSNNDMDPGTVPEELIGLSRIEEQLISKIHPVVSVYKIKKHQLGYSGNIINFPQDVKDFAQKLPHNINDLSSMITVRTSTDDAKYKDFQVRCGVVKRALLWLQKNNPFYFDVVISDENLCILPDDGNLHDFVKGIEVENDDPKDKEEPLENKGIEETSIPLFRPPATEDQIENVIGWPSVQNKPIDEFNTIGYIAQAFPCLFPFGRADLRTPREHKVKEKAYFQHLMRYKDERFSKHSSFRFFALNSIMRWMAIHDGGIFVQRHPEFKNMTVDNLRKKIEEDPSIIKKIMFQSSNIGGTKAYWYAKGKELQAMIEQLSLPTIFLTLSAADLHWPELFDVVAPDEDKTTMTDWRRRQLVQENPMVVDQFFMERIEVFLAMVLKKKYDIADFWFRIEYQHRGSPHFHGLLWLKDAPDVKNLNTASTEELQKIIEYFDELVSTVHPNPNEPPAPVHPSKLKLSEVPDLQQDLATILNRVQIHSVCSESYCLRKEKHSGILKCRFGFPNALQNISEISFLDNDVKFIPKRNHTTLNKYNPYIIQSWRANIDVSPVLSEKALTNYLAKYISKSETKSKSLVELLKNIMDTSDRDKPAKHAIQRLFIKSCSERDFSAQETCHILMGTKLVSTGGRNFLSVNFNENSSWIPVEREGGRTRETFVMKYKNRMDHMHECIWKIAKNYKVKRGAKQNIVMVYPKINFRATADDNEAFYKQQCLLYLPWHNDENMLLEHKTLWKEVYDEQKQEIMKNVAGCRNIHVEPDPHNDEDDDHDNNNEVLNLEDWMTISRMGPDQNLKDTDLGLRETDLRYDWHTDSEKYDKYGGIASLQSFLNRQREEHRVEENKDLYPDVQFSDEQVKVLNLVHQQIEQLKNVTVTHKIPKRTIVQGKAGTGKSLIISAIVSLANESFGYGSVLLLGPTGVSAVNINGSTYHSKLKINLRVKEFLPLQGPGLFHFREELKNVKFVILDEFSMVGCEALHRIDERLRQASGKTQEQFGGFNIFLFGDIRQLNPVGDTPAHSNNQVSFESLKGKHLFNSFEASVILEKIHRQKDEDFQKLLNNIGQGCVTKKDYDLLKTRFTTSVAPSERQLFTNVLHLYPTRVKVRKENTNRLECLKELDTQAKIPVARIPAVHNSKEAFSASIDEAEGLDSILYLGKHVPIMLRSNIWTERGLVNGATGTIVDILYGPNASPGYDPPAVLICKFDSYKGPYLDDVLKTVPIVPINKTWNNKNGVHCTRIQFPVHLAFAATIHKSQGLTLTKAFVDLGSNKEDKPGLAYVGLSRAKSLSGLLLEPFPFSRLVLVNKSAGVQMKIKWEMEIREKMM